MCLYPSQDEDVLVEAMEEDSESDASGSEDDFRELRARKHALTVKVAEQQRRRDKIQVWPYCTVMTFPGSCNFIMTFPGHYSFIMTFAGHYSSRMLHLSRS